MGYKIATNQNTRSDVGSYRYRLAQHVINITSNQNRLAKRNEIIIGVGLSGRFEKNPDHTSARLKFLGYTFKHDTSK